MKFNRVIIFYCLLGAVQVLSHARAREMAAPERKPGTLRIVFYNVENLFEPGNDPGVADDEFTPDGRYQWNYGKYKKKILNIAKTLIALGGWEAPDLVGLAEIENWQVLYDLSTKTPLNRYQYRIIHENSPDVRGIDTGVLYIPEKLEELSHRAIQWGSKAGNDHASRDILYIRFLCRGSGDTLHVFVNHWPSRLGGKDQSSARRNQAARQLKEVTDSLFDRNKTAKIVVLGDFNDEPDDESIAKILDAAGDAEGARLTGLYNLMYPYKGTGKGTLYHQSVSGGWNIFDQVIVSDALLNGSGLSVNFKRAYIFDSPWLLDVNGKPYRSFRGPVFTGGYSDHLPVYIDLAVGKLSVK